MTLLQTIFIDFMLVLQYFLDGTKLSIQACGN
jgi:hypothetical protein